MKVKMMKMVSLFVTFIMMVTMLASCGNSSEEGVDASAEGGKGGDKELVFWNIGTENVDKDIYDKAVEIFNSTTKSGYTVTSIPVQNDTYKEKLVIAMSSGECPDMYIHWSGGPMNEYVDSGYAKPITEQFNESELPDRLVEASIAQATYKDDIYAVPIMDVSISGIYYNKELFEKYELEVPETLSELEEVCDTLVENEVTPFALANSAKWTGSMYFMNLAARKGGLEPFTKAVDGSGTFEDECFIYAGDKIREWSEKGYFPEGVNSLSEDDGQARQMLYQETAAMDLIGSWYSGIINQDSPEFYEKVGWFPFPAVDDSEADPSIMIGTIGNNFISFNCEGEKLEAALEFAGLFSEEEMVDFMVEKGGKIPPVQGASEKLTDPIMKQISETVDKASSTQLWYDQYLPPAVAQAHLDTSQELFGLTMSSEDAAKQFQEAMVEYREDTK